MHITVELTEKQRSDLQTVAAYLREKVSPEDFDMYYASRCVLNVCHILDVDVKGMGGSYSFDQFLFGSGWHSTDNTPIGAAQRIEYVLKHGVPENWRKQMTGRAPLSYKVELCKQLRNIIEE